MRWLRWVFGTAILSTGLCLAQTPVESQPPTPPTSAEAELPEPAPAAQPVVPELEVAVAPATSGPEEVLVTGEFPGPGLWKVMRRDDPQGHVLWILGTPPPLPKKLKWKSKDVEAVLLASQAVLLGSEVDVEPNGKIGFFKGMSLLPSIVGIRNNPDKGKLKDLVPADLYEQWLVQKKKYLGRNETVEAWRPIFAAEKLRDEAFDDTNLRESGVVWDVLGKLAKQHKINVVTPRASVTFNVSEIKSRIQQFKREPMADAECFAASLRLTEMIGDAATMNERARAWATGDLKSLLALPPLPNTNAICAAALLGSQVGQDLVPKDIVQQLNAKWLEAAEKSLAENQSTLALLKIAELTGASGRLAALREKGYVVEEP